MADGRRPLAGEDGSRRPPVDGAGRPRGFAGAGLRRPGGMRK
ncbi:hypothetical protein A33M_2246 [Rhodovulum sp. PH10]|nr:hypothetical protein A33M_2246 [Rhodovulum sp. PH10]